MCLFANGLNFSELFDDISLLLNVRRLRVNVDSPISAAKVCDCAHGVDRYVMSCLTTVSPK